MQKKGCEVILGSGSPRRKKLLGMICDDFQVVVSDCEEVVTSDLPESVTMELSLQKAEAVWSALAEEGRGTEAEVGSSETGGVISPEEGESVSLPTGGAGVIVIGADTVVSIDGKILGKPRDRADARDMLQQLSGRVHQVTTGVTLIRTDEALRIVRRNSFAETTLVHVDELTDDELQAYLDTEEPYDKAGAYGIQGLFARYISGIEGDYNNVVGLPVHRLYRELSKISE